MRAACKHLKVHCSQPTYPSRSRPKHHPFLTPVFASACLGHVKPLVHPVYYRPYLPMTLCAAAAAAYRRQTQYGYDIVIPSKQLSQLRRVPSMVLEVTSISSYLPLTHE